MTKKIKHKNAILAAEKIANIINYPTPNKEITFLFGAGINFNISKNPLNWDTLAKKSIEDHLKIKKYNSFELDFITKNIKKINNNNMLSLSFSSKYLDLTMNLYSNNKNLWFLEGYYKILNKLNNKVKIMTLNYDLALEELLERKSINLFEVDIKKLNELEKFNSIIHLHGLANKEGKITKKSLLTLKDYISNTKIVEEKILDILKINEEKIDTHETIIIIGTNLKEHHLLRSFHEWVEYNKEKKQNKTKNIYLIGKFLNDESYLNKIKDIYKELNIQILNISDNYNDDYKEIFKVFWKKMSNNIYSNNIYSNKKNKIIFLDDYFKTQTEISSENYNSLKKH